jgi:tetratricopeptide (TPR) repeat protein
VKNQEHINSSTGSLLDKAYRCLKAGDAEAALGFLDEELTVNFENREAVFAEKVLKWWLEKMSSLGRFSSDIEKGCYILSQWKLYYVFAAQLEADSGSDFDTCQYVLKHFVYSKALLCFSELLDGGMNRHDPELLFFVGKCYKGTGDYDSALNYIEQAARFERDNVAVLSELADVKALLGDERQAKALLREAFFLDPQGIDLRSLECEFLKRLVAELHNMKVTGAALPEWLPVLGSLLGVFSVKRELKSAELGRLKQSIFALENELRLRNDPIVKPRLLNRYIWLLDHYENEIRKAGLTENEIMEFQSFIEQTKIKFKILSPKIFAEFMS